MKSITTLKGACDEVVHDPKLKPVFNSLGKVIETFCNQGAEHVAACMGCFEFAGLNADQEYQVMDENRSGKWLKVTGEAATAHALQGGLAFAAMTSEELGDGHGHIAAIYPDPMGWSPSLNKSVPKVANVGKTNQEENESAAFPVADGEPDYFCWNG